MCGLLRAGEVHCWGSNEFGLLGDPVLAQSDTSVQVLTPAPFEQIGLGATHACGLSADGSAYCWGTNRFGQLGIGGTAPDLCGVDECSWVPVAVDSEVRFHRISVGGHSTCAITREGEAYCWGSNEFLQLGGPSSDNCNGRVCSVRPQRLDGYRFAVVEVGTDFACGVTTPGQALCWGRGEDGRRGDGTIVSALSPARVLDP